MMMVKWNYGVFKLEEEISLESEIRNEWSSWVLYSSTVYGYKISGSFCLDVRVAICYECVVTRTQESEISLYDRYGFGLYLWKDSSLFMFSKQKKIIIYYTSIFIVFCELGEGCSFWSWNLLFSCGAKQNMQFSSQNLQSITWSCCLSKFFWIRTMFNCFLYMVKDGPDILDS